MIENQITFTTQCYQKDYLNVLDKNRLLHINKILNSRMDIIINKCEEYEIIKLFCSNLQKENLINNYFCVNEEEKNILNTFNLARENFSNNLHYNICLYGMAALYFCKTNYLCFFTGDSTPLYIKDFVKDSIEHDKNSNSPHTYMLRWCDTNGLKRDDGIVKEDEKFFYTTGFSDTNFLINTKHFNCKELLQNYIQQSSLFPHIDAFEARFFAYMRLHNIHRCVYKHGEFLHRNYE